MSENMSTLEPSKIFWQTSPMSFYVGLNSTETTTTAGPLDMVAVLLAPDLPLALPEEVILRGSKSARNEKEKGN